MTAPTCTHCLDTGSLSRDVYDGTLDCTHCGTATERAAFETWLVTGVTGRHEFLGDTWLIYQRGKAAAADDLVPALRGIHGWAIEMLDMAEFKAWPDADRADFMLKMRAAEDLMKNYPRKA
jgi:hypothetical protein